MSRIEEKQTTSTSYAGGNAVVSTRIPLLGLCLGTLSAVIWGVQAVVSRQSVADELTTVDVAILRFATAGVVLLPLALKRCRPFPAGQLGWPRALLLTLLAGAPYSLVLVGGAAFAPALHSAVIAPGLIPLIAAALGWMLLGARPSLITALGLLLIAGGLALFSWEAMAEAPTREGVWRGDLLFVLAAMMWATFGVLSKRWGTHPVEATATICVLSLLSLPLWAPLFALRMWDAQPHALLLQAAYQGIVVGVVSLILYTRTIALLGGVRAALFLPLVPIVAALAGAIVLGEEPTTWEWIGMTIVAVGMAVALSRDTFGRALQASGNVKLQT